MTQLIVVGLRITFTKLKSKDYTNTYKEPTTTAVYDIFPHKFKYMASTKQPITLKMNVFDSTKMETPEQMEMVDQET